MMRAKQEGNGVLFANSDLELLWQPAGGEEVPHPSD
jgi:hypothetical protein